MECYICHINKFCYPFNNSYVTIFVLINMLHSLKSTPMFNVHFSLYDIKLQEVSFSEIVDYIFLINI